MKWNTGERANEIDPEPAKLWLNRGPSTQMDQQSNNTGPLTIVAENMTGAEVDHVVEDTRRVDTEIHIRYNNDKVLQNRYKNLIRGEKDNIETIYKKYHRCWKLKI